MYVIGLVGGIASGKSAVARELASLGAVVLDADQVAHEILNLPTVRSLLVERWGEDLLLPTGDIDRSRVAAIVFSDSDTARDELRFLEGTLHPLIRQEFESELQKLKKSGERTVVIDAPLLLEVGWDDLCDSVIFVDAPLNCRLDRARQRNWTIQQFSAREASQMPIEEKKRKANHLISNSGTLQDLTDRVHSLWPELGHSPGKT